MDTLPPIIIERQLTEVELIKLRLELLLLSIGSSHPRPKITRQARTALLETLDEATVKQ
jgi:hypothetical protein